MQLRVFIGLLAFIGLASAHGYQEGKQYDYKYYGIMHTALPGDHHSHTTGMVFKSIISGQNHGNHAIFKLHSIKAAHFHGDIPNLSKHNFEFKSSASEGDLSKPFKVVYDHGKVKSIIVAKDDPLWSVNIKKGAAAMTQLDLEPEKTVHKHQDDDHNDHDDHSVFKVMEEGIAGECEVAYTFGSEPSRFTPENQEVLNVTKHINFENCHNVAYRFSHFTRGDKCVTCDEKKTRPVRIATRYLYNLKGGVKDYVIEDVNNIEEIVLAPYTLEGQQAHIFSNRSIHLVDVYDVEEEFKMADDVEEHHHLTYEFEHDSHDFTDDIDLKESHYLAHLLNFHTPVDEVDKLIEAAVSFYDGEKYSSNFEKADAPMKFLAVLMKFETLNYDEIETLYNKRVTTDYDKMTEDEKTSYYLFMDVLAMSATNPSFLFSKKLIEEKKVCPRVAKMFVRAWQFTIREPSQKIMDEFRDACHLPLVTEHPDIYSGCKLSFAAFVHDKCVREYHDPNPNGFPKTDRKGCNTKIASKYFKESVHAVADKDETKMLLYIKTAANFGIKETIDYVRPIIQGREYPETLRVEAIWALWHVGGSHPHEVTELLVPIGKNRQESYPVRIAAFTCFLVTNPPLYILEGIAGSLYTEPNMQVVSWVHSTFKYFANSTYPCFQDLSRNMKNAYRIIENLEDHVPAEFDQTYSRNWFSTGYNKRFDFGGFTNFAYIADNASYIPKHGWFEAADYLVGKHFDSFAISWNARGFDKFLDKIFGPNGLWQKRRHPRDTNTVEKELKEIEDSVPIKHREYEDFHLDTTIYLYGQNFAFLSIDEKTFAPLFQQSSQAGLGNMLKGLNSFKGMTYRRFFLSNYFLYLMPSQIGLPFFIDHWAPTYLYYKNHDLKVDAVPQEGAILPKEVSLEVDGHYVHDTHRFHGFGFLHPGRHYAGGILVDRRRYVSLPIKGGFNADITKRTYKFKWTPIPHDVYHHRYTPITFFGNYVDDFGDLGPKVAKPIFEGDEIKSVEKNLFHDSLGLGLTVKGQYFDEWMDYGSWWSYYMNNDFRNRFYYYVTNPLMHPYNWKFSLTPSNKDQTREVETTIVLSHHGPSVKDSEPFKSHLHHVENEFEQHLTDHHEQADSCQIDVHIKATGQKERTVDAEMYYMRSEDNLAHKFGINYDRSPFSPAETDHFKFCFLTTRMFPKHDLKKLFSLDTADFDPKLKIRDEFLFGKDCDNSAKVIATGDWEYSKEQKEYLKTQANEVDSHHHNPYQHYYHLCKSDRESGHIVSQHCMKYIELITKVHEFDFDLTYENVPDISRNFTRKYFRFVTHFLYNHVDYNDLDVQNDPNKVTGYGYMEVDRPVFHEMLKFPNFNYKLEHAYWPYVQPITTHPAIHHRNWQEYTGIVKYHTCIVEPKFVRTFDNLTYPAPTLNSCYKVVAKDCSPNDDFLILGANLPYKKFTKGVKVFIGKQHKIEILPVSENSELIVRVNGQAITLNKAEPIYREYVNEKGVDVELFHIDWDEKRYTINSERYGLTVHTGGKIMIVQVKNYYRGKVCGICGEYNRDTVNEMMGPDGTIYHDPTEFVKSYVVKLPGEQCEV